jgi:hypothetical protein
VVNVELWPAMQALLLVGLPYLWVPLYHTHLLLDFPLFHYSPFKILPKSTSIIISRLCCCFCCWPLWWWLARILYKLKYQDKPSLAKMNQSQDSNLVVGEYVWRWLCTAESADTCTWKFPLMLMGPSRQPRPKSKDRHKCEWKLICSVALNARKMKEMLLFSNETLRSAPHRH